MPSFAPGTRYYLQGDAAPKFLNNLRAEGRLNAERLRIHNLVAERVSAALRTESGHLTLSNLRAHLLGGEHRGDWEADIAAAIPVYAGSGTLTNISLGQLADTMQDAWISGTGGGTYEIKASGKDGATFWQSAEGKIHFDVKDAVLQHISLEGDNGPLQVSSWDGQAQLHAGKIEIEKGSLISAGRPYEISGTASLGQVLDLKLVAGTHAKAGGAGSLVYSITGTVAEPRVELAPSAEAQARLKP